MTRRSIRHDQVCREARNEAMRRRKQAEGAVVAGLASWKPLAWRSRIVRRYEEGRHDGQGSKRRAPFGRHRRSWPIQAGSLPVRLIRERLRPGSPAAGWITGSGSPARCGGRDGRFRIVRGAVGTSSGDDLFRGGTCRGWRWGIDRSGNVPAVAVGIRPGRPVVLSQQLPPAPKLGEDGLAKKLVVSGHAESLAPICDSLSTVCMVSADLRCVGEV